MKDFLQLDETKEPKTTPTPTPAPTKTQ